MADNTAEMQLEVKAQNVDSVRDQLRDLVDEAAKANDKIRRGYGENERHYKRILRRMASEAVKQRQLLERIENGLQDAIKEIREQAERERRRAAEERERAERERAERERRAAEERAERERQAASATGRVTKAVAGLVQAYVSLEGARKAVQWAQEGARMLALESAYAKAGFTVLDLQNTIEAAGGALDKTTAQQMSNVAHSFGLPQRAIEQFARIASAAALKTGEDFNFMFNSLVTGTARQSAMIIDNLGITIKLGEANAQYAKQLGKTVEQMSAAEKKQAFLNGVLEAGNKIINDAPLASFSANLGTVNARLKDILDTAKKLFADKFAKPLAAVLAGALGPGGAKFDSGPQLSRREEQLAMLRKIDETIATLEQNREADAKTLRAAIEIAPVPDRAELLQFLKQWERNAAGRRIVSGKVLDALRIERKTAARIADENADLARINRAEDAANQQLLDEIAAEREARAKAAAAAAKAARKEAQQFRKEWSDIKDLISDNVAGVLAASEKRAAARDAAALEKYIAAMQKRHALLRSEIGMLQNMLDKSRGLTEQERERIRLQIQNRMSQLPSAQQNTIRNERQDQIAAEAQQDVAAMGTAALLVAKLNNVDVDRIKAIKDALHEGIVQPMQIAADTAGQFGASMADAAAAAILEGKSIKKATNEVMRSIARKALALAIFEAAAALASLALYDFKGAALHGKAAAMYGIVAAGSAAGAAATGGLRDRDAGPTRDRDPGRTVPGSRSQAQTQAVSNVYNISMTGLRNRREDRAFVLDVLNSGSGMNGAGALSAYVVRGAA